MKEYFHLQYKMTYRRLEELGLHPVFSLLLISIAFIGLSLYLFTRSEWTEFGYAFIGLALVSGLSEPKRNDFIKQCYSRVEYIKLRLLENTITAVPFLVMLLYQQMYLTGGIMLVLALLLVLIKVRRSQVYTIPTFFSNNPFEFTVGFRKSFYLVLVAYVLTIISVSVGNFNLGLAALVLVFLVSFSFYAKPEDEYYVWIFSETPKGFLKEKIKTGIWHSTILSVPILITLGLFFFSKVYFILIVLLLGYIYLMALILAKYSAFPHEINVPQGILLALSFFLPPMLLGVIPFFYSQSIKKLKQLLI